MEDNVMIKIKTYQDIDGDGDEPIELETSGKFGMINGKYYIKYKESELTGFPDTTTTIKVWDSSVAVTRKGKMDMKLLYQKGEKNLCLYPTPYGAISALIETFDVEYDFSGKQGKLRVDYTLDPDNENVYKNSLRIEVCPVPVKGHTDKPKRYGFGLSN